MIEMLTQSWPFTEAENTACLTQRQIVNNGRPILLVAHDADDGCWQFLDGSENLKIADGMLVTLADMVQRDPSLADVADLPLGWMAWREEAGAEWQRMPNEQDDEEDAEAGGEA
jgi:hypothetical protein